MVLCSCDRSYVANREALVELCCVRMHGDLSDGRLRRLFAAKGVLGVFCANAKLQTPAYACSTHFASWVDPVQPFTGVLVEDIFMLLNSARLPAKYSRMHSIEYSPPATLKLCDRVPLVLFVPASSPTMSLTHKRFSLLDQIMYIWNNDHEQNILRARGSRSERCPLYEVKMCTVSGLCLCGVVHPPMLPMLTNSCLRRQHCLGFR